MAFMIASFRLERSCPPHGIAVEWVYGRAMGQAVVSSLLSTQSSLAIIPRMWCGAVTGEALLKHGAQGCARASARAPSAMALSHPQTLRRARGSTSTQWVACGSLPPGLHSSSAKVVSFGTVGVARRTPLGSNVGPYPNIRSFYLSYTFQDYMGLG